MQLQATTKEHKLIDRAAMIEAASHSLRQQMRARDRPRSKGSLHDMRDTSDPPQSATSQRRIHSAENKYRMVKREDGSELNQSVSSSALDTSSYPAEEEPEPSARLGTAGTERPSSTPGPVLDDIPPLGDLKRPMSRKKVPSASAAEGLGACLNPVKMTDAFERRKTRQPIPIESWGPRPPSRNRLPPNATFHDASLLNGKLLGEDPVEPKLSVGNGASRSRSEPNGRSSEANGRPSSKTGENVGASSTQWAAARYPAPLGGKSQYQSTQVLSEPSRGRKAAQWGSPEKLGIVGMSGVPGTRSPNGQTLSKNLSGVFDHHSSEFRERMAERQTAKEASGSSWAAHVDTVGALEVSGSNPSLSNLGDNHDFWLCSPSGGSAGGGMSASKSRYPQSVQVEDFEADQVPGMSWKRDPPAQVVVTRSSAQKKERGDVRRGRDERLMRRAETRNGLENRNGSMPFSTSLDVDFLSLFAL